MNIKLVRDNMLTSIFSIYYSSIIVVKYYIRLLYKNSESS